MRLSPDADVSKIERTLSPERPKNPLDDEVHISPSRNTASDFVKSLFGTADAQDTKEN
jgi:hypothetical protein